MQAAEGISECASHETLHLFFKATEIFVINIKSDGKIKTTAAFIPLFKFFLVT